MFSSMTKLAFLLAVFSVAATAESTHGNDRSTDVEPPSSAVGGNRATVIIESTSSLHKKGTSDGDGGGSGDGSGGGVPNSGGGSAPKSGGARPEESQRIRVTGYPLFLFTDGPDGPGGQVSSTISQTTIQLIAELHRKVPGARVVRIAPLSVPGLADAWKNARAKNLTETSLVTTALLIIDAKAAASSSGSLRLMTTTGPVDEPKWRGAVRKLSESIFGKGSPDGGKLETVLLTNDAGAIHCRDFPGPVFGATRDGLSLDRSAIRFWLDRQRAAPDELFPLTAREWFDDWRITSRITHYRYFFCPYAGTRGYLGNKKQSDGYIDTTNGTGDR